MTKPINAFYGYSHKDEVLREELEKHLHPLERLNHIRGWSDRSILAGTEWEQEIERRIDDANLILLLISPDFLASKNCIQEMEKALKKHEQKKAHVVPIILRPVAWEYTPIRDRTLQLLPKEGKPVTRWPDKDEAFLDVVHGITRILLEEGALSPQEASILEQGLPTPEEVQDQTHQREQESADLLKKVDAWLHRKDRERKKSLQSGIPIKLSLCHQAGDSVASSLPPTDPLLILGELGAGKTNVLLDLALELCKRAKHRKSEPIPVVFSLASWTKRRQPLADWLAEELAQTYGIAQKTSQQWVNSNQILPLLDDLDKIPPPYLTACIEALNVYMKHHLLVICCRSTDYQTYMSQPQTRESRLQIQETVVVQPLTTEQVDDYLLRAGGDLAEVRKLLHDDTNPLMQPWREMGNTPLMLYVLIQAFQGISVTGLKASESREAQQKLLLTNYVQHALKPRDQNKQMDYTPDEAQYWLAWLAWQLTRSKQKVFSPKRVEPDWIAIRPPRRTYFDLAVRWGLGLWCGLFGGLLAGLLLQKSFIGSAIALVLGIPFALSIECIEKEMNLLTMADRSWKGFVNFLKDRFHHGLLGGLLSGYLIGVGIVLLDTSVGKSITLALLLSLGGFITITLIVASPTFSKNWSLAVAPCYRVPDIRPLPSDFFRSFGIGFPIFLGALAGIVACFGFFSQAIQKSGIEILSGLFAGLFAGLLYGILACMVTGLMCLVVLLFIIWGFILVGEQRDRHFLMPKQDIWHTAGQGVFLGLGCGLFGAPGNCIWLSQVSNICIQNFDIHSPSTLFNGWAWLVSGHLSGAVIWTISWLAVGLVSGLISGALFGLLFGGTVCMKHMIMHGTFVIGWTSDEIYKYAPNTQIARYHGYVPEHFVAFLDDAVDRTLLHKVSDGYIFIASLQKFFSQHFSDRIAKAESQGQD